MKYFAPILAGTILALLGAVSSVGAAETIGEYTPLAPLPGTLTSGTETTNLPTYLAGMMKLLIAVAGSLAFLMMIIGGTEYVAAGITPDAKSNAKDKITNAIVGLILTLVSYLILLSINPKLVEFNLTLPEIQPKVEALLPEIAEEVAPWGGVEGDYEIRSRLLSGGSGKLSINNADCETIGQTGCTSVFGLGETAIRGLINLANDCTGCKVVVTGGTEYWLHGNRSTVKDSNNTSHKPGNNVVDISINDTKLNDYIRSKGTIITSSEKCPNSGTYYQIGSAVYVDERVDGNDGHWHACY
mgnify:CR=1 FL=1